jgi:ABC-type Fe3+ transport system permease subunit
MHLDATGEDGRGTLLVVYAGWRRWVLGAWKIPTERADAILPRLRAVVGCFGDPCAVMRDLGRAVTEAARDLGATPWQTFRLVTLPLIMPGVVAGALMAFTLSLDDFIISFFTAGVGSTTLPIKVYGMLKSAVTPEVNALSAILVLVSMALVAAATWVQRRDVGSSA